LAFLLGRASIRGTDEDYQVVIRELEQMQERLRTLRFRLSSEASNHNVRYHALSAAVSQLNRVIADLRRGV
jgi:hypothetical protein